MNKILFFAELREKMGAESIELDLTGKKVEEVKEIIEKVYSLTKVTDSMVAVNEEFARNETEVEDGDTIAFIPPVSGG
ncbi:molybdopterin converting factor subunit 1 [Halobacillus sp. BBL2006]|uniref:molybdopterin converting factor subunit 1 n=1 Tax=Halobacillus sp. BBL2006 TaxID=1543706 RepID=UPI0005444BF1|nr:molybdopterin converting factor subunit 1 [Halobacillus sp. BBL2006]KHE73277.1 molybdenum cofactor biosynthesis protein MoaD [Halobacillus sp. BBL2006]